MMPEWVWTLLVGGVLIGLIGVVYRQMLTKSEHAELCRRNSDAVRDAIKSTVREEMNDIREYFDLKIENVVLKEIRKMNSRDRIPYKGGEL